MKILFISIGTRGDMEPFLAIAELMQKRGHEVTCQFPEQFRTLAEDSGFGFESLGTEFIDLLNSDAGKLIMGGGGSMWQKMRSFAYVVKQQSEINKYLLQRQFDLAKRLKPDRIVHNGKAIYPVLHEAENPGTTVFISPVPYLHYVKGHSHVGFHSNYGTVLNKLTFTISDMGLVKMIMSTQKSIDTARVSKARVKDVLKNHKIVYTISPQLFPRPKEWADNLKVLGYHERDKTSNWSPSTELEQFLLRHPKIVLVTFGSMTNPHPVEKTQIILNILQRNGIAAIVNTSSGGIVEPADYNREVLHFVSQIPYDWIFPKMYAVVHHGGSGTTHMALKNACASMIIPQIIDQFVWNEISANKGMGPKGIPISKITEKNLEPLILDLLNTPQYKSNAEALAEKMRAEDFADSLHDEIVN